MKHTKLMFAEGERMKPFKEAVQEIEARHITFLKSKETIYQKFGNRLRDHFIAMESFFRWHIWTDLTPEIKKEVEEAYNKFVVGNRL